MRCIGPGDIIKVSAILLLFTLLLDPVVTKKRQSNSRHVILHKRNGENEPCKMPPNLRAREEKVAKFIFTKEIRNFTHLKDSSTCPPSVMGEGDTNDRSFCPWYYEIHHDHLRAPPTIAVAKCKCRHSCLDQDVRNRCEPIEYPIRVLKRTNNCDSNGFYIYRYIWEKIAVACVCARQRFVEVSGK